MAHVILHVLCDYELYWRQRFKRTLLPHNYIQENIYRLLVKKLKLHCNQLFPCIYRHMASGYCDVLKCKNGGTCAVDGDNWHCRCPVGYKGDLCGEQGLF